MLDVVLIRSLGLKPYFEIWQKMQHFTMHRHETTQDEIWFVEHFPVFTQGQAGKSEHILNPGNIPIIQTDRGGQVTYHGPGQLVAYVLIDIQRKKIGVRQLVTALEQSVISLLASHGVTAKALCHAPGVYVNEQKICSVGLRIKRGASYHGLALNVAMDLEPFKRIHPCGYEHLSMTQLADQTNIKTMDVAKEHLVSFLIEKLGYTNAIFSDDLLPKEKIA